MNLRRRSPAWIKAFGIQKYNRGSCKFIRDAYDTLFWAVFLMYTLITNLKSESYALRRYWHKDSRERIKREWYWKG